MRARGLRTGVRTLRRSLALSGWGGLRLGGLCLGRPLPLGCTPLRCGGGSSTCGASTRSSPRGCGASARSSPLGRRSSVRPLGRNPRSLVAQRCLARRRRHITAKSPGASRSAILTLCGQAICEVAAGLKLADKRNDPKNAQPQAHQAKESTSAHKDAGVNQVITRGDRSGVGDVGDSKNIGTVKVGVRASKRVAARLIGAESCHLVVAPVQLKLFAGVCVGYRGAIAIGARHHAGGFASGIQLR